MSAQRSTVGRIAPSPSGRMHLGNAFSALLAWAHARSRGGSFVLRLENLDERCRPKEHAEGVLEDLTWLGIDWDDDPVIQSDRIAAYDAALDAIGEKTELYPCFCTRSDLHVASAPHASDGSILYPGTCYGLDEGEREERMQTRRHALRLHVPDETIGFVDAIQGPYAQNLAANCGDFVLRRSDGVHAYQLVCVVDDAFSGVTDIVRGSDLLSSTPRQLLLYELLDAEPPRYAHHPLLLAPDGRRLSKRDGDLEIASLRERGVSSEEIVGHVATWAGQIDAPQPMTAAELANVFDLEKVPTDDLVVSLDSLGV